MTFTLALTLTFAGEGRLAVREDGRRDGLDDKETYVWNDLDLVVESTAVAAGTSRSFRFDFVVPSGAPPSFLPAASVSSFRSPVATVKYWLEARMTRVAGGGPAAAWTRADSKARLPIEVRRPLDLSRIPGIEVITF